LRSKKKVWREVFGTAEEAVDAVEECMDDPEFERVSVSLTEDGEFRVVCRLGLET